MLSFYRFVTIVRSDICYTEKGEKIFGHATEFPFIRCYGQEERKRMEQKLDQRHLPPVVGMEMLFSAYADMVYRLAYLRTKSASDAEDVTQEVFLRCIKSAPAFFDAEHQKAWLIRVTLNYTKTLLTSAWRRHSAGEEVPERASEEKADLSDVYQAVSELPQKYRTAIHLYYYEGYSVKEIASLTASTEATVKSQLFRARGMLRERLKGEYFDV